MEPGEPTPSPYPERVTPRREPAPPEEYPATAAEPGIQPTAGRPALPRRRKQNSLAPELANAPQQTPPPQQQRSGRHERSSEQARDLFSEIESGTRRGRMARPEQGTNYHHRREGQ